MTQPVGRDGKEVAFRLCALRRGFGFVMFEPLPMVSVSEFHPVSLA